VVSATSEIPYPGDLQHGKRYGEILASNVTDGSAFSNPEILLGPMGPYHTQRKIV
jgi:hypothetical protein